MRSHRSTQQSIQKSKLLSSRAMELFDDYKIIEELHKGTAFVTLRAFCNETNKRVILKTSSSQWPNPIENIQLQQEYGLLKSLDMISSQHPLCLKQQGSRNY